MERSRLQLSKEGGIKTEVAKSGWGGAGGRHGQEDAGASACGTGIDGHISHSSMSRQDHRTWLRGGSAWSAVTDFTDICWWGDTSCDKDCPRHEILSSFWAEAPRTVRKRDKVSPCTIKIQRQSPSSSACRKPTLFVLNTAPVRFSYRWIVMDHMTDICLIATFLCINDPDKWCLTNL